jgi:tripartite-type tricarboxylate transporter receptor subunit TctC
MKTAYSIGFCWGRVAKVFATALAGVVLSVPVLAQDFKASTPVRIIVPYGPGGPTDVVARMMATPLQNILKQTVIVENRAGAGSVIGARFVANAAPDGHTLLLGNVSTFAIAPATMKNPGYDPTKSFAPVVQTSDMGAVMVTSPSFPANTLQEFIAYAKANPGKVSYGSAGVGNSAHLMGELLQAKAQLDIVHVPYRSGAEMSMAVLAGQVQFAVTDLSASIGQIRDGKLKALAVTGNTRSAELANVPTMIESGFTDMVLRNWTGVAAPAGTHPAMVRKLQAAMNEVIKSPEYQASITKIGGEAKPGTSEELVALIAQDYKRWSEVAKAAKVSLD